MRRACIDLAIPRYFAQKVLLKEHSRRCPGWMVYTWNFGSSRERRWAPSSSLHAVVRLLAVLVERSLACEFLPLSCAIDGRPAQAVPDHWSSFA